MLITPDIHGICKYLRNFSFLSVTFAGKKKDRKRIENLLNDEAQLVRLVELLVDKNNNDDEAYDKKDWQLLRPQRYDKKLIPPNFYPIFLFSPG